MFQLEILIKIAMFHHSGVILLLLASTSFLMGLLKSELLFYLKLNLTIIMNFNLKLKLNAYTEAIIKLSFFIGKNFPTKENA